MTPSFDTLLRYDPDTGNLFWRVSPNGRIKQGEVAGCVNHLGYVWVKYSGKRFAAHRIAWLLQTGEWPSSAIDHRNLDRSDNRWSNLRLASAAQNSSNRSGYGQSPKGVKPAASGRFVASITVDSRKVHLGTFDTEMEASAAYASAAFEAFGEFARAA